MSQKPVQALGGKKFFRASRGPAAASQRSAEALFCRAFLARPSQIKADIQQFFVVKINTLLRIYNVNTTQKNGPENLNGAPRLRRCRRVTARRLRLRVTRAAC